MEAVVIKTWNYKRFLRLGVVVLVAIALTLLTGPASYAQFVLPEGFTQANDSSGPPADVTRYGGIEVASVRSPVDDQFLFHLASPTVYDRHADSGTDHLRVEQRAEEVEARLLRVIQRPMDPETLEVRISRLNNVTVIAATDTQYTRPLVLVSVTDEDADYHGKPIDELAVEWQGILETELQTELQRFSSEAFVQSIVQATRLGIALVVLTGITLLLRYGISRRQKVLRRQKRELQERKVPSVPLDPQYTRLRSSEEALEQHRTQFLHGLNQVFTLDRRLALLGMLQWLLFWLLVLSWYIGLFQVFRQIPSLTRYSGAILGKPIELLAIWFLTGLAIRISRRLIDQVKLTWQENEFIGLGDIHRRKLRTSTITGAAKGLATVVIAGTGLLWALQALGIPTGSVLALGGLVGLAISFGSQSLVKDLVNGCLILAEDQFAIGDVIDLGHVSGLVEELNLRVTQLRSANGELITIPNSAITEVKNLTRTWSRVNFSIDVAYQTDPAKALSVLQDVAKDFYEDPEWHDKMLHVPDVLGIDHISHTGMTITTWIQTAPAQQWAVGREFRFRVRQAMEAYGIDIGIPQQTLQMIEAPASQGNGHPPLHPLDTPKPSESV